MRRNVYTTGQIATITEVSPRTVTKWIDNNYIDSYRIPESNHRRVQHSDLVSFLIKHEMQCFLPKIGESQQA